MSPIRHQLLPMSLDNFVTHVPAFQSRWLIAETTSTQVRFGRFGLGPGDDDIRRAEQIVGRLQITRRKPNGVGLPDRRRLSPASGGGLGVGMRVEKPARTMSTASREPCPPRTASTSFRKKCTAVR